MQGGRSVSQFRADCFRFEQGVGSRDGGVSPILSSPARLKLLSLDIQV